MATGSTDAATSAEEVSDELAAVLTSDEPLAILACPSPRQVLAAAAITADAQAPVHLRVVGADRPPISTAPGPILATAPGFTDADVTLSPYTPMADVEDAIGDLPDLVADAAAALKAVGSNPAPGMVATHDSVEEALAYSSRLHVPAETISSTDAEFSTMDEDESRSLSAWLTAAILAEQRPTGAREALQSALAPTACEAGLAPTAEGFADIIGTVAQSDPGVLLSGLLRAEGWDEIIDAYERAMVRVRETIETLPAGDDAEVATATVEDVPAVPAARRWASSHLSAPYGVITAGEEPAQLTLVASGDRSASAVLETVANRLDGTSWGSPFVATALLATQPPNPQHTITEAL